ncbi:retrotransposon unclassified [Nannochloropsis gaditana]|uniref:Retrotransposon unclassified n=1 Tax=Nannochloropsis gaditana TaxID=72520 RepID=W7TGQ6_9STRA|nr:retrotransposon unclassified [Nannochloropsis gaditana]
MYMLDYYYGKSREEANVVYSPELWHQRFGHMNYEYLRQMGEIDGTGVPKGIKKPGVCGTCERAKQTKRSFGTKSRERAKEPLELVHTDVLGPVEVESLGGARYAIGFTDDYTRWRVVYPMKHKSESLDCLKRYIQDMNISFRDHKVNTLRGLRSDNGGEYTGIDFKNFCKNHGIRQDFGMPYGPQDNGLAEKSWHILCNMARALRIQAGLGKGFWAEALNTAAYIWNRSRNSALGPGETPYYKMFGKHASVKHLRTFGCKAFVHDTSVRRGKFDDRAVEGILIGYDDIGNNPKCYRIYIPSLGRYIRSGHVTFDEETFPARVRPSNIRVETYHN